MLKKNIANKIPANYRAILEELGYRFVESSGQLRTRAVYRDGRSSNSLVVYLEDGSFYDFPTQKKGTIAELIALTKGLSVDEVNETLVYHNKKQISFTEALNFPRIYNEETFLKLPKIHYEYFESRGISKATQIKFEARFCLKEKMAGRIIFPIRNFHNQIIGVNGRSVNWKEGDVYPKWLLAGAKRFFVFNHKVATPVIQRDNVIVLVESMGDSFSLSECGIDNAICLFGLTINKSIIQYIISQNPSRIIISTNNDKNNRGQEGAEKIRDRLVKNMISDSKISINFPPVNDWNDVLMNKDYGKSYITDWYKKILLDK